MRFNYLEFQRQGQNVLNAFKKFNSYQMKKKLFENYFLVNKVNLDNMKL